MIVGGWWSDPRRYRSRSEADLAVIGVMVKAGFTDTMIAAAFEEWFIGARFRELLAREGPRRADDYLVRTIAKARGADG